MKEYVKPELYCESFELSQHIAACGIDVNQADTTQCQPTFDYEYWYDNSTVFEGDRVSCATDIKTVDAYCYTSGANEAGRLFNS